MVHFWEGNSNLALVFAWISVSPWCSGYHHRTTSFNKAWTQDLCRFKCYFWRVRDLKWWGSLTMVLAGNKAKHLSPVNHTTKTTHHQQPIFSTIMQTELTWISRVALLVFLWVPSDAAKGHVIGPSGWDSTVHVSRLCTFNVIILKKVFYLLSG